jgi:CubicO group peptidase (beta-lactamase class C family)
VLACRSQPGSSLDIVLPWASFPLAGDSRWEISAAHSCCLRSGFCWGPAPRTSSIGEGGSDNAARFVRLKVMEFNIEYGGEEVDFDAVVEAIERSDADVVGIEEAWGNMPRLAKELGWPQYDARTQIISRYPLLAPSGSHGLYTLVAVQPGSVVAMGNVHLPAAPYGPFRVRDGATPAPVLALERRTRLPPLRPTLRALAGLMRKGIPAFLVGDFNAPSELDWTEAAVGVRDHVKYALDWPVSDAVAKAGFRDSYREVHPDPVRDAGLTWPAARPYVGGYNPARNNAPADRIDFVYAAGRAKTIASALVGERGGPDVRIPVSPWPTDHRGVLSTFDVAPAPPPTLVAVEQRVVELGEDVEVRFHAPGDDGERVVVVQAGGDPDSGALVERATGEGSPEDGRLSISTEGWPTRAFQAVLVAPSGEELSRIPFWVRGPGARARVRTTRSVYEVGDAIEVEWRGAPGNRWDWLGVYRRGADPNVASYLLWAYTDARPVGSAVLDAGANGPWPLRAGEYSPVPARGRQLSKARRGQLYRARIALRSTAERKGTQVKLSTRSRVGTLVMVAALAAPTVPSPARAVTPASAPRRGQLQMLLDRVVAAGAPGAVAFVKRGGGVRQVSSGVADLDTSRPLSAEDRFRIGSVTKTFVATVVLQLVDEGRLSLSDSVQRWLPDLLTYGEQISVRELLNHTSGVPDYVLTPIREMYESRRGRTRSWSPRELVELVAERPPLFSSGTTFSYSNTNYVLAGLIVRKVADRSLRSELARRILEPLALSDTSFPDNLARIPGRNAKGYSFPLSQQGKLVEGRLIDFTVQNPSWAWAAGNMVSDHDDLSRFFTALLQGRLLSSPLLETMKRGVAMGNRYGARYGLGLLMLPSPCGTLLGHNGGLPGFSNSFLSGAKGKRQAGVMVNVYPSPSRIRTAEMRALIGAVQQALEPCGAAAVQRVQEGLQAARLPLATGGRF